MEQIGLIGYGSMADMIARQLLKHEKSRSTSSLLKQERRGAAAGAEVRLSTCIG